MNRKKFAVGVATTLAFSAISMPQQNINASSTILNNTNTKSVLKTDEKTAVVSTTLNLRKQPEIKNGNVILTMKKGSKVDVISINGQWAKVKYGNKEGYASLTYLSIVDTNAKTNVIKKIKVNTASLNVRAGAGTNYKLLGSVKRNAVLDVYEINNSWAKINYNGKYGYVSTNYTIDTASTTANTTAKSSTTESKKMIVVANSLNVRSGAGTKYAIKGKLTEGTSINVLSISDGWAKFVYNGSNAYVDASYLKEETTQNNKPVDNSTVVNKNMYVLASKTSVRKGEGTNYSILGTLKQNESIYVKKHMASGWSQVTYNNKDGYVLTKDLIANVSQSPSQETSNLEAYKQEVLRLVNIERAKEGLGALCMDSQLSKVAQLKSQDMINNDYFAHNSPVYGTPFEMMKSHGITYKIAGENIAMGHSTPQEVVNGWMNSESHRNNIMNSRFTNLGMGIAQAKSGRIYWTQMFTGQK